MAQEPKPADPKAIMEGDPNKPAASVAGAKPDTLAVNQPAAKVETASGKAPPDDMVAVTSKANFHEHGDQTGKFLTPGDKIKMPRDRAVELRANGLVSFDDEKAEKEANELHPLGEITDNTNPGITSRSFGTRGRR